MLRSGRGPTLDGMGTLVFQFWWLTLSRRHQSVRGKLRVVSVVPARSWRDSPEKDAYRAAEAAIRPAWCYGTDAAVEKTAPGSSTTEKENSMRRIMQILLGAALVCVLAGGAHARVDNSLYAELLARHVVDGLVDYAGLKADEDKLDAYLAILAAVKTDKLTEMQAYAHYLNVYNAWTLKLILKHYPGISSIKDIGGFFTNPWRIRFVELDGELVHLDHVEHEILRPRFRDPRVHFAVNCASMGCPRLHARPFEPEDLETTLDELTRANINDPAFNRLENGALRLVKVFDWFGGDWGNDAEKLAFVLRYADDELRGRIESRQGGVRIRYTDWDWSLNDVSKGREK
jgi:hypothetical protein